MSFNRFTGQSVVVTGGSSGIGKAAAARFASEGALVMIGDINEELGLKVVDDLSATGAMALDHAHDNIRVNAVCPGAIDTPLFEGIKAVPRLYADWMELIPMGRTGRPEEIASVVAFLASDDASYMTGSIVTIDGGQTTTTGTPNFNKYLDELKAQFN